MGRARLSINVNKYALLRNSRGHDVPNLVTSARTALLAGAHGITVHPRRDERHVKMSDLRPMWEFLRSEWPDAEFNIECEDAPEILELVLELRPHQCTLVPVTPGEVTSDHGWTLPRDAPRLESAITRLKGAGIRVSCFADCEPELMARFADTGTDRVELYTGPYAWAWGTDRQDAETARITQTAAAAERVGLGLNAGHDLDRHNLAGLRAIPNLDEVSIGHAQICRALDVGTTQSVAELLAALGW